MVLVPLVVTRIENYQARKNEQLLPHVASTESMSLAVAQLAQQLSQQATLLACLDYFSAIAFVGLLGLLIMLTQRLMK